MAAEPGLLFTVCASGGLDCYASASGEGGGGRAVYGRVARDDGRIVLQYWFLYYDDVYSYEYPPSNFIWQAHEGDWEVVNVVLSEDERPLFVGYSQHCLGQRRPASTRSAWSVFHPRRSRFCEPSGYRREASGVSSSTSTCLGPIGRVPFGTSPQGPGYHAVLTDLLGTLATWPEG